MTDPRVVVCGEALIDLTPDGDRYAAHPGGGPFNTAVALGRLGIPTAFCSRVSDDGFGRLLRSRLTDAGVDQTIVVATGDPTSLAVVTLNERGEADYQFYVEGTADRGLLPEHLPSPLAPTVAAIHFGTLSLVLEPGASTYELLMRREHGQRLLALDPNCRPRLIPDREAYRRRLEGWVELCDLVKVSSADLDWLYPELGRDAVAARWRGLGAALVVITDGGRGATGYLGESRLSVPTPEIVVADTIGAGDTFNAGLLAWLDEHDRLTPAALARLTDDELVDLLGFAAAAAAVTCSRPGADPPWRREMPGPA